MIIRSVLKTRCKSDTQWAARLVISYIIIHEFLTMCVGDDSDPDFHVYLLMENSFRAVKVAITIFTLISVGKFAPRVVINF